MAQVKISELPSASSLTGSEVLPVVQGGSTLGATVNQIKDKIQASTINVLKMNASSVQTLANIGELAFNPDTQTLEVKCSADVTLSIGQENYIRGKNAESSTILNGTVVYVSGGLGANSLIKRAGNADGTAERVIGIATQDIGTNNIGFITTSGVVNKLDTSAYAEGDLLWLGTNGAMTNVKPDTTVDQICIGVVLRSHATQGSLLVAVKYDWRDKLAEVRSDLNTFKTITDTITDTVTGKNLYNNALNILNTKANDKVDGKSVGEISSPWIPVNFGVSYVLSNSSDSLSRVYRFAYKTSDGNIISVDNQSIGGTSNLYYLFSNTESINAKFIRFSAFSSQNADKINTCQFEVGTNPTQYEEFIYPTIKPSETFYKKYEDNVTEVEDIRRGIDGNVYNNAGDAVRGQIISLKDRIKMHNETTMVNPLVIEMIADFNWVSRTEVAAFNGVGAYVDPVSNTPNNAFFKVTGTDGSDYVNVIDGGNASTGDIISIAYGKPFGAVLKHDDGTYTLHNAWYRDDTTISIYPRLVGNLSDGELGNIKTGIHLSRRGYEAFAQKIYNTNPKWCEKSSLIAGYMGTQSEPIPFSFWGNLGLMNKGAITRSSFNTSKFMYAYLPTFYRVGGVGSENNTPGGIEWDVDLSGKSGYVELFVGTFSTVDTAPYEYSSEDTIYIDLYLDGVLAKRVNKTTTKVERICIDYSGADNAKLQVYMNKFNDSSIGFSISAIYFWENKMQYNDTNYIVPKFATIAQMFDSWGEFHDYQSAKSLKELHNGRCGVNVPYENHSKGSQTSVWGKAWFYENAQKHHPSHMLTNFLINDFNSEVDGGLPEKKILGPDGREYDNVVNYEEYIDNIRDLLSMASVNNIQPIFVGTTLTNIVSVLGISRSMPEWYIGLVEHLANI